METKWADHVTSDPQVLAGKPIVRGTRLAVDFILGLFASGWKHQVLQNYPSSTAEALRAVFACAADVLHEELIFAVRSPAV